MRLFKVSQLQPRFLYYNSKHHNIVLIYLIPFPFCPNHLEMLQVVSRISASYLASNTLPKLCTFPSRDNQSAGIPQGPTYSFSQNCYQNSNSDPTASTVPPFPSLSDLFFSLLFSPTRIYQSLPSPPLHFPSTIKRDAT